MVATLTWNLDANGMTFATSFSITTQARRVRTGRIKFSCLGRLLWAGLFASVCSPPRLSTTQLTLATRSGHVSTGLGLSPVSFMFSSSHVIRRSPPKSTDKRESTAHQSPQHQAVGFAEEKAFQSSPIPHHPSVSYSLALVVHRCNIGDPAGLNAI